MAEVEELKWVGRISSTGRFYYVRVPRIYGEKFLGAAGTVVFKVEEKPTRKLPLRK